MLIRFILVTAREQLKTLTLTKETIFCLENSLQIYATNKMEKCARQERSRYNDDS